MIGLSSGMRRVASPKDRKYLESLNLKALQKSRPKGDQDPKEYYKTLQDEAKSATLVKSAQVVRSLVSAIYR